MDPQQIKALIDAMASSDLQEMEFSQDGWTLRLMRQGAASAASTRVSSTASAAVRRSEPPPRTPATAESSKQLVAPLFGVLHWQSAPGEPPFVVAGQSVKAGQTLCVIEAMKVFNEVRAEHDAVIDAVLAASGQEVEAGQALLRFA
ncbi:MAG TPA: acetyl-CoA carboxylase biotin carboxyl carrier protein subunit [Burkholderiaceae bacterium]|nr:acetyl-CoA carboxylase biotin carboxyl carrier protein subunit [Burkholderiaceae bacterium]